MDLNLQISDYMNYSPVLLVLGSGESRPSTGGPSSFPLGGCGGDGESWQF